MKKVILSLGVILVFIAYSIHEKNEMANVHVGTASPASNTPANPTTTTGGSSSPQKTTAGYKDGTYTGDSADAYYGNIQVQAVIQNGKITDVQFLQYPNDRGTSVEINTQAMPLLKQE